MSLNWNIEDFPDTEAHWYDCAGCGVHVCFDCKNMDVTGEDWCPECADIMDNERFNH